MIFSMNVNREVKMSFYISDFDSETYNLIFEVSKSTKYSVGEIAGAISSLVAEGIDAKTALDKIAANRWSCLL